MATDISKLGLKAKWQDLTEGMIVAGAGTSAEFRPGNGAVSNRYLLKKTVNNVCSAFRFVRTAAFLFRTRKEQNLTMTTARDAASV